MISVITCVNDEKIYNKCFERSKLGEQHGISDIVMLDNTGGRYKSAAEALNIGLQTADQDLVVCCHQDVFFPEDWAKKLYINIEKAKKVSCGKMGVLGTAGVLNTGEKRGYMQDGDYGYWNEDGPRFGPVQTVDESCFIFDKSSGLKFDERFDHFHFYGADLCLQALHKGLINFGIDAPVIHYSGGGESSMGTGRAIFEREMMKLKKKWISRFPVIWTTTVVLSPRKEAVLADYLKGKR